MCIKSVVKVWSLEFWISDNKSFSRWCSLLWLQTSVSFCLSISRPLSRLIDLSCKWLPFLPLRKWSMIEIYKYLIMIIQFNRSKAIDTPFFDATRSVNLTLHPRWVARHSPFYQNNQRSNIRRLIMCFQFQCSIK